MSKSNGQAFYLLTRQLETFPSITYEISPDANAIKWLGVTQALIEEYGTIQDRSQWSIAVNALNTYTHSSSINKMQIILYRCIATVELHSPDLVRGTFIPAGGQFDAFASVSKIFDTAESSILIVDPWLTSTILTDYICTINKNMSIQLLTAVSTTTDELVPAVQRWNSQAKSPSVEMRRTPKSAVHDRLILVDTQDAWIVTQSFKDLARSLPASLVKADPVSAGLKHEHYRALWDLTPTGG